MNQRSLYALLISLLAITLSAGCGILEDSTSSCLAMPVCESGDAQVDECPDGATCYENSMCNSTILCEEGGCNQCPEGSSKVAEGESCDADDNCTTYDGCSPTLTCKPDE